jgi:hypothetical protein
MLSKEFARGRFGAIGMRHARWWVGVGRHPECIDNTTNFCEIDGQGNGVSPAKPLTPTFVIFVKQ